MNHFASHQDLGTSTLCSFWTLGLCGSRSPKYHICAVEGEPCKRMWNYHCEVKQNNMKERKEESLIIDISVIIIHKVMTIISTSHRHYRNHHLLLYAREDNTGEMP